MKKYLRCGMLYMGGIRMIKIHLSRILGELRMTQRELSRRTGINPNTISKIYREEITSIDISTLDRLCAALGCGVGDILEYIPKNEPDRD